MYPNGYAVSPAAFWPGGGPAPLVAAPAAGTVMVPTGQGYGGEHGGQVSVCFPPPLLPVLLLTHPQYLPTRPCRWQYTAYAGNGPMAGNFPMYRNHAFGYGGYGEWGEQAKGSVYPGTYGELATLVRHTLLHLMGCRQARRLTRDLVFVFI